MRASDHRKAIPVGVKLRSCLILLGYTDEQIACGIQFDHFPAITLRTVNEAGELVPAVNDPHFIRPMLKADHDIKTRGRGATTAGSDVGQGAKLKRIVKDPPGGEEFRRRVLAVKSGDPPPQAKTRKRPIQSRGFGDQNRPFPNRSKTT